MKFHSQGNNMSVLSSLAIHLPLACLFSLFLVKPSHAFLSAEVMQAMDKANYCNINRQNDLYSECMKSNYEQIKKVVFEKVQQQTKNHKTNKKRVIMQNIDKKIKLNSKICLNENNLYGDSMNGERRHPYCLYENMLEILINVERNIEFYAH